MRGNAMREVVIIPFFPKVPWIFRLPVRPVESFGSWKSARSKPKFHDNRHIHKIDLRKGNYDTFERFQKIRRHK